MTSASSRVLSTYELLDMIFEEVDPLGRSHPTLAYVCKLWSDVCLDYLWKEVYGLHVLFRLLGDMYELADNTLVSHSCCIVNVGIDLVTSNVVILRGAHCLPMGYISTLRQTHPYSPHH
jgi:hypothetical protein